jgi:hypothetical protein
MTPSVISAAPVSTSGQEVLGTLSPAQCAALKAAYPQDASDPRMCKYTHGWTKTVTSGPVTANQCPAGRTGYNDYYGIWPIWEMDLDTTWQ